MTTQAERIRTAAEHDAESTARFLADIVSIPSLSCEEGAVVERIGEEMTRVGFDEVRTDGLGSIIGRIGSGKTIIAMDAHIDTVDVGNRDNWSFDPYAAFVKDGKVWGRGTADQKGGMASMVAAGKLIKELGLAGDYTLIVTGTVMEEDCDGLCWQYLIEEEKLRPDLCIITEPTGLGVYRGHRGRMEIELEADGVSAHGSAPERGENAIYAMARAALGIEKLNEQLKHDDFLGKGTVVASEFRSGAPSLCAVADFARLYLDRRLTQGETKESAIAEVERVLREAGIKRWRVAVPRYEGAGYTGKVYPTEKYYPTWTVPADHPAVTAAVEAYEGLFGAAPTVDKWTFSTNGVAICGKHGIPCVGFGPGYEEQAHAPDEFTPIEHIWKAAAFYAQYPSRYVQEGKKTIVFDD